MSTHAGLRLLPLLFAPIFILNAQSTYTGTLNERLAVVDDSWVRMAFKPAREADFKALSSPVDHAGIAYADVLPYTTVRVVIVDVPSDSAVAYADLNADGKYAGNERFPFYRLPEEIAAKQPGGNREACFDVPLSGKAFQEFPVCTRIYDAGKPGLPDGAHLLYLGISPWAIGSVTVGSRKLTVGYEYDPEHDSVNPMRGWQGFRESSAGSVNFSSEQVETAYADNEQFVFRVEDLYLSTESIDLKQHKVVLRSHPAADYVRVELRRGIQLPDWKFIDLKGRPGSLKSFGGKYVLLDVWTGSCGPCLGDFAMLKSALKRFGPRKFDILGVLGDDDESLARKQESAHELPWRTAASSATLDYVRRRLRVASTPIYVLIDPEGRIVSASSSDLHGEALISTLQKLLPR